MRRNKKLITTLTVFVLILFTSIFCMTVFAEKDAEDDQKVVTTAAVVSGCDLKKEELQMVKVKMAGFSMLVPQGDIFTVESDASAFTNPTNDLGINRNVLISENAFFYFNNKKENYCQVYAGFEELKPLESYYGDYSDLNAEQQKEIMEQNISEGDTSSEARFEKINGRTYLLISKTENDTSTGNKYAVYAMYTVIGSYKYIVQVVVVNPNKSDLKVVNEMLNSIKLNGLKTPLSSLEIALIVCVVILIIAVAFAYFTLYRVDRFVKSGAKDVKMFGLNLPEPAVTEDDSDDDDESDDEDAFSNDADGLSDDEKIISDDSASE